jgi:hypothetical protein
VDAAIDDLIALIRGIARDEIGVQNITRLWGYVDGYDPINNNVQVLLPQLQRGLFTSTGQVVSPWLPLATPMVGPGYGLRYSPPVGTPCYVEVIDTDNGAMACAGLLYNVANAPFPGKFFGEDLAAGELEVVGPGGASLGIKLSTQYNGSAYAGTALYLNGANAPADAATPIAVEGSCVTHGHTLYIFIQALTAALNVIGATPLTGTSLATVFAGLTGANAMTDTAGDESLGPQVTTHAAIDTGQGVQSVLSLPAGQS